MIPIIHTESDFTASTVANFAKKLKELGVDSVIAVDLGNMRSSLKSYNTLKENKISPILGMEFFFKDKNCDIINGTNSEKIRYFKGIILTLDQAAYQKLVTIASDYTNTIVINEEKYPLFNWNTLQTLSEFNTILLGSDCEDMVTKHLLTNCPNLGEKYFLKLKQMFGEKRYYPSIVPQFRDMYWEALVKLTLPMGKIVTIPAKDRVEILGDNRTRAIDIVRKMERGDEVVLSAIYINKIRMSVAPSFRQVIKSELTNDFKKMPIDVQLNSNRFIMGLCLKHSTPYFINSNSYMANKDDKIVQDMKFGETMRFSQDQHILSDVEIKEYMNNMGNELGNMGIEEVDYTLFRKQFDNFELKYDYLLPEVFDVENKIMEQIAKMGRMDWNNPLHVTKLKEEMLVIAKNKKKNLLPYFMPIIGVREEYVKKGCLYGPARGSAGGSWLSYVMGVTHINPLKHGLQFSRFMTLDRIEQGTLPDIDVDLNSRDVLVGKDGSSGYLYETYGDRAAQVSTRTLLRLKSSILDANRFINKGEVEEEIQQLAKSLPGTPQGISDYDFLYGYEDADGNHIDGILATNDALQQYALKRPKEWEIVLKAVSLSRQCGRHACAYVIADRPIESVVPLFEVGGVKRVTQCEAKQVEKAGLIKYDFLVVSCLEDIAKCIKLVNNKQGKQLNVDKLFHKGNEVYVWDLPEDKEVFRDLAMGKTETVFQLSSSTMTDMTTKIQPKSIDDIGVITSLGRPGPLGFIDTVTGRNMAQEYIERRFGRSKGDIEALNRIVSDTYGVIVYQEQVTKVCKELGGLGVIESENVRIAMGKKKVKLLAELKPKFIEGASKIIDKHDAEKIWSTMATFASYSFNQSHAIGYSYISYACAFLKHHYPLEWWAAILSNATDKQINEEYYRYVKDIVLPPDINISNENIVIDYSQGKLRHKLSMIAGLGTKASEKIIDGRPYHSIEDFIKKKVAGDSLTKKLIFVGVLDSLFPNSSVLQKMQIYEDTKIQIERNNKIQDYYKKMSEAPENTDKIQKNLEKYMKKEIPKGIIDPSYMVGGLKAFLLKKSIFPTMPLDLGGVIEKSNNARAKIIDRQGGKILVLDNGEEYQYADGHSVKKIDEMDIPDSFEYGLTFASPAYLIECEEFYYKQKTKKALKITADIGGYISEKVLWPDRISGELEYPDGLSKGSVCYVVMRKKGSWATSINKIILEI